MADSREIKSTAGAVGEKFNLSAALGEIVKYAVNQAIDLEQAREPKTELKRILGTLSVEWGDDFIIRSDNPWDSLENICLIAHECSKRLEQKSVSIKLDRETFDRLFILPNLEDLKRALAGQNPMEYILMDLLRKKINAGSETLVCDPEKLPYFDEMKSEVVYPLVDGTEVRKDGLIDKGRLSGEVIRTELYLVELLRNVKNLAREIRQQEEKAPIAQLARASERGEVSQVRTLLSDEEFKIMPTHRMGRAELLIWAKAMRSSDPETYKLLHSLLEYDFGTKLTDKLRLAGSLSDIIENIESTTSGHKGERRVKVNNFMTGIICALVSEYRGQLAKLRYASLFDEFRSEYAADIIGLLPVVSKSLIGRISPNALVMAGAVVQSDFITSTSDSQGKTIFHLLSRLGDLEIFDGMLEQVKKLNIDLNHFEPKSNPYVWMFAKESPMLQLPVSEQERFIRRLVYAGVEPPVDIATLVPTNEAELITREYLHRLLVYLRIVMQHVPQQVLAAQVMGYLFGDVRISEARGVRVIEEPSLVETPQTLFQTTETKSVSPEEAKLKGLFKQVQDVAVMADDSPLFFAATQWLLQARVLVDMLNKSSRSELPVMDDEKHKQNRSDLREFKDQVVAANELMVKLQTKSVTGKVIIPEVKKILSHLAEAKGCPGILKEQLDDVLGKLTLRAKPR